MRRLTWLLFTLLIGVIAWSARPEPAPIFMHASQVQPPEVVAPEGVFVDVFDMARPATLRIESRSPMFQNGPVGVGTGFFVSSDGLVLTANHVVDRSEISSQLRRSVGYVGVTPEGEEYELELVGFDAYMDLAVLRATVPQEVHYLPLAERTPRVGTDIVAIGNSGGDFLEGRAGRVSRLGVASPRARFAADTIELTAALSPGDSGGPIINAGGEVVGVVSYISFRPDEVEAETDRNLPENLRSLIYAPRGFASYAVPVTLGDSSVVSLMEGNRRDIPVVGFGLGPNYVPGSGLGDLGPRPGLIIGEVQPGGPADLAGLKSSNIITRNPPVIEADVITAIDDRPIRTGYELIDDLYRKEVGQTVTLTVQRGGETIKVRLELGAKQDVFR